MLQFWETAAAMMSVAVATHMRVGQGGGGGAEFFFFFIYAWVDRGRACNNGGE